MLTIPLRIHHWLPKVRDTLGPGTRAIVWVQGCTLACKGCMVPETWSAENSTAIEPQDLARQILEMPNIEGVTVSGGEPTQQAIAVAELLSILKSKGLNTWLYSGYTIEELVERNDAETDQLLSCVDVLVDGRFQQEHAGIYRWRGSANQRIIHLTDVIPQALTEGEESGGVEITVDAQGELIVVGVPPPHFLEQFRARLKERGVTLKSDAVWK